MRNASWVDNAVKKYLEGWPLALLFDFDGTLTPIVSHPKLTSFSDTTRDLLSALAKMDRVTVGVVSGRAIGSLKELIGIPEIAYAGSGGMSLDFGDVQVIDTAMTEFDQYAGRIVDAVTDPVREHSGAWIETKPGCITVHHRALTPLMSVCLLEKIRDALADLLVTPAAIRICRVSQALEIMLADAWTKADAIDRMLTQFPKDAFVVFAGDGANDDEAVAYVNALGGMTIGVGSEPPTQAIVRIPTPESLAADLAHLRRGLVAVRRRIALTSVR